MPQKRPVRDGHQPVANVKMHRSYALLIKPITDRPQRKRLVTLRPAVDQQET